MNNPEVNKLHNLSQSNNLLNIDQFQAFSSVESIYINTQMPMNRKV